jgi:hypothetical protein
MTFDLVMSDFAFLINIRRIKRAYPEAAQAGHTQVFSLLGDDP